MYIACAIPSAACKILITSMDLRMTVPLSQEKMRFIKEGITKLDYKVVITNHPF